MTLPNLLSISRVFLLIPIIFLFEKEFYVLACIFFIVASLTDFFDGYIARKRNLESDIYGKLKTTFQMISLGFLLISSLLPPLLYDASLILIFFSALLSWYSLLKYLNKWIV